MAHEDRPDCNDRARVAERRDVRWWHTIAVQFTARVSRVPRPDCKWLLGFDAGGPTAKPRKPGAASRHTCDTGNTPVPDSLSVTYNLIMRMTDFIDGTYVR